MNFIKSKKWLILYCILAVTLIVAVSGLFQPQAPSGSKYGASGDNVYQGSTFATGGVPYVVSGTQGTIGSDTGLTYNAGTGTLTTTNLNAPTGRGATLTVSASVANGASQLEYDQADYKCDGVADNVQIQAAIDALSDTWGGVVQLSAGQFNTAAAIAVSTIYVTIRGKGQQTTRIQAGGNYYIIDYASTATAGLVEELQLDGLKATYATSKGIISRADSLTMRRVTVFQPGERGIYILGTALDSVSGFQAFDTKVVNAGFIGWEFKYAVDYRIDGCMASSGSDWGFKLNEPSSAWILNSWVDLNANGIYITSNGDKTPSRDVTIQGCEIQLNTGGGIFCNTTGAYTINQINILNNRFSANGAQYAMYLDPLTGGAVFSDWIVKNNHFDGATGGKNTYITGTNANWSNCQFVGNEFLTPTDTYKIRFVSTGYLSWLIKDNMGQIWSGESRTASGSLVAPVATLTNGTGTFTGSVISLKPGANTVTCTVAGTGAIVVPTGSKVTVATGTMTVTDSPKVFTANGNFETTGIVGTVTVTVIAQAFAWQNPEAQAITILEVMVDITAAGGTATAIIDVGSVADAYSTASDLINDIDANAIAVSVSTARNVKLTANGGATDWITGNLQTEIATLLVGKYYIKYMGQ